jgi:hypothetical protein
MTGPVGIIRRAVSFIFDPVPRVDRKPITVFSNPRPVEIEMKCTDEISPALARVQAAFYRAMIALRPEPVWLDEPVEWPTLDELAARHPRSSPARLRPYDWQVEHAWPVEGWVL